MGNPRMLTSASLPSMLFALGPKMDHDWLGIANRLERFRNRHNGEQLVLICNGPSLNRVDFDRVRGKKLMGLNKIFLGFKRYRIYPFYYVAVNQEVLSQSYEQIRSLKCVNFIPAQADSSPLQKSPYTHWIKADLPPMGFSLDLCNGVHQGWTVTHVALQIAYFMGFQQVVIIGMDHKYHFTGIPNELANMTGPDPNHFSQDYFQNLAWNNPDLHSAEDAFRIARHTYEAAGRSIIDCTEDGA
ncbi:MAG: hypothetical protein WAM11_09905, partial [Cyanobium sp.]